MRKHFALIVICLLCAVPISSSAQEVRKAEPGDPGGKPPERTSARLSLTSLLTQAIIFLYEDKTPPDSDKLVQGQILGTAFIVGIPHSREAGRSIPFVVTAKHVIANRAKILGRYSLKAGGVPGFAQYDLEALRKNNDLWEHPGDEGVDIVVFRTPFYGITKATPIPIDHIASREVYTSQHIDAADRIMIPCLLAGYPGISANYPIFRDGSIALITEEPIQFTWMYGHERITTKQRVVFVNSTFNEGFSGAPVFLWPGIRLTPQGNTFGGKPWLLGIVHGFQPLLRPVIDGDGENVFLLKRAKIDPNLPVPPKPVNVPVFSQENSAIGMVFPSWQILEILQSDAVKKRIHEISEEATPEKLHHP